MPSPFSTIPLVAVTASSALIDGARRVKVNQSYIDALLQAGLVPVVVPPIGDAGQAVRVLDVVQGLVLTGGEDVDPQRFGESAHSNTGAPHHSRDACEIALARDARRRQMPTLAICRGVQLLNVALGGTLIQDIPSELGTAVDHNPRTARDARVHRVQIVSGSALADAIGAQCIETNSFHHQALRRVADHLRVSASSDDGVIEGVESTDPDWWMLGVQWHPEDLVGTADAWDRKLFAAFAHAVGGPHRE
jgi:putative glutamine amidotransferase